MKDNTETHSLEIYLVVIVFDACFPLPFHLPPPVRLLALSFRSIVVIEGTRSGMIQTSPEILRGPQRKKWNAWLGSLCKPSIADPVWEITMNNLGEEAK